MRTRWKVTFAAGGLSVIAFGWMFTTAQPDVTLLFCGYKTNTIVVAPAPVSITSNIVWAKFQLTNGSPRSLRYSNFRCMMETREGWFDVARPVRARSAQTLNPEEALSVWVIVPQLGRPVRAVVDFSDRGLRHKFWDHVPRWLDWSRTNHTLSITLPAS